MNRLEVADRKVLRGNVIERLYANYGDDLRIATLKNLSWTSGLVTEEELKKRSSIWAARASGTYT